MPNTTATTTATKLMSYVCHICPFCLAARHRPAGKFSQKWQRVQHKCPFCRAYTRVEQARVAAERTES